MEGDTKRSRKLKLFDLKALPILEDEFKMEMVLGCGTFAQVSQAKAIKGGRIVAVKRFNSNMRHWEECAKVEMDSLRLLHGCAHIIAFLGAMRDKENAICAVIEYVDYNLQQIFEQGKEKGLQVRGAFYPLQDIKGYFKQILLAVDYMHARGVMHRDLWPQNVLLTSRNVIKVADFGMADIFDPQKTKYGNPVTHISYRAPEVLLGDTQYDCAIDMWSVGCIFGYMLVVHHLFQARSDNEEEQLKSIFEICGTPNMAEWHPRFHERLMRTNLPPSLSLLTQKLLQKKLHARRMKPQVLKLLEALLTLCPTKRISAQDALKHPCLVSENPTPSRPEEMAALENVEVKRQRRK